MTANKFFAALLTCLTLLTSVPAHADGMSTPLGIATITSSMLASGAAKGNLSLELPGLTSSVQGTDVPGLDGGQWSIYRQPASVFNNNAVFSSTRDDSNVQAAGTGPGGAYPFSNIWAYTKTNTTDIGYTWGIVSWQDNNANASTGAQNVALAGTIVKQRWIPLNTTSTASGNGTTATITFAGSAVIPVGHHIYVSGMTPSGYNGHWKVSASSAGSVSFLSSVTGAQTVAGTLGDESIGPSWAGNLNCTDQTSEPDPVASCIGLEVDNYSTAGTTDANKQRVGIQIQGSGGHIGYGVLQATKNGAIYDRAYAFNGSYGLGLDFTGGTFTSPAIMLATGQQICFDGTTAGVCARNLTYTGGNLTYTVPGGTAFAVGDGGTVLMNKVMSNSTNDLTLTAASARTLKLGVNGVDNVYTFDTGGFYPTSDNARSLGQAANRWSTIYGINVGSSGTPITNGYFTNLALGATLVSKYGTEVSSASANVGSNTWTQLTTKFPELAGNGGGAFAWNYSSGGGETDLFVNGQSGSAGFNIYKVPNTSGSLTQLFGVSGTGDITVPGNANITGNATVSAGLTVTGSITNTGLPGLTSNVSSTGIPGLSGGHWMIRTNPGSFDATQTLRIDRIVSGTGTAGGFVYPTQVVNTTTSPTGAEYEWGLLAVMHNQSPIALGAQNVALQGTINRDVPTNTVATLTASGTGTTATVTFSGGATIPVGDSVLIAGMTPSGYNGTYKVTASSAGSVSFASATTGAQTVAGTIVDVSVTNSWGLNSNVILNTDEKDQVGSAIGAEFDITNNGSVPTTDNGNVSPAGYGERVGVQINFNGTASNAGSHAGRAILIGTGNGNIWDRGISFQNNYGTGIDFVQSTITGAAIALPSNGKIALDATAPAGVETFTRYLSYNATNLAYHTASGDVFTVSDNGSTTLRSITGTTSAELTVTSGGGQMLGFGTNGTIDLWRMGLTGNFAPVADNTNNLGGPSARIATGYFTSVGDSTTHVSTVTTDKVTGGTGLGLNLTAATSMNLFLGSGGTDQLWQLDTSGHLFPFADNSRNFGSPSKKVATAYGYNFIASTAHQTAAAVPAISSCGTTPPAATAGSSNNGGQFTLGTGTPTTCTVTFATAFPTTAFCTITPASAYTGTYYISAQSRTAFTVTLGTGTASVVFNYSCNGN